jgi:hypothetical protein
LQKRKKGTFANIEHTQKVETHVIAMIWYTSPKCHFDSRWNMIREPCRQLAPSFWAIRRWPRSRSQVGL